MTAPDVRIGLEIHVYLRTSAKLFCACPADALASPRPNAQICPVCTGQPGAKPMAPDRAAIEAAVRIARALGCRLRPATRFLRKHYFYPDLPSNYQRTSEPVGVEGSLDGVRIRELHVEEDPGQYDPATGLIDYDRSGAPLVEIVTEPDLASPAHARHFLQELRLVLGHLGVSRDAAGLKADCNVSVAGGERAEVKNVNSVRNVERAIAHEVERQSEALARGDPRPRETRHFDETTGRTSRLRLKESEADYRYLADPDLRAVDLAALDRAVPVEEAPLARRTRLAHLVGVPPEEASPLVEERALADAFERAAAAATPRAAFDFFVRDLRGELTYRAIAFSDARVDADDAVALVAALHAKEVTPPVAKRLLREALDEGGLGPRLAAERAEARPAGDALGEAARAAVAENPRAVADFRAGKATAVNFLMGQAMRKLQGRAPADEVRKAVEDALRGAS